MDKGNAGAQKDDNREKRLEGQIQTWKQRVMEREGEVKRLGKMD